MAEPVASKAVQIGGVTVTVSGDVGSSAGARVVALLKFLAKWAHSGKPPEGSIDNSLPEGPPNRPVAPDQPPGSPNYPSTGPVGPGRPVDPGYGVSGDKPSQGGDYISNDLPSWIANNADEIAKLVLKSCFECDTAKPHK